MNLRLYSLRKTRWNDEMDAPFEQFVTFLATRNLPAVANFYQHTLGLPLARDQGSCHIYHVSPGGYLGFCTHLEQPTPAGVILTLVRPNVDEWHSRLSSISVEITQPPRHNPRFGIYHFFFRDPNGYLLEIQRFDEPLQ